jgi:hypothetical protein
MRDNGARLDQKYGYRSSLEKLDHPVCQTEVSDFHRENLCSKDFLKKIQGIFRHDVRRDIRYLYLGIKRTKIHEIGLHGQNRNIRFAKPEPPAFSV